MERDIFIIAVYSLVAEMMPIIKKKLTIRTTGFAPKFTDAEVITLEICGEFFKLHEDTEIYRYFKQHYLHYFPNLPSRTTFVRQAANLWQVKVACQSLLVKRVGQERAAVQSIDTLPLPVCTYPRGGFRERRFPTLADGGTLCRQANGLLRLQTGLADFTGGDDYSFSAPRGASARCQPSGQLDGRLLWRGRRRQRIY